MLKIDLALSKVISDQCVSSNAATCAMQKMRQHDECRLQLFAC